MIRNIGVHLNTAIKGLKVAVKNAETGSTILKQVQILENQCDRFLREHGAYGDLANNIKAIKTEANSIKYIARKTMKKEDMEVFVKKIEKLHEKIEDIALTIHYEAAA